MTHSTPSEQDSIDGWSDLCALDQVPDAGGHYVVHSDRPLAVFRRADNTPAVTDDTCPHAGGSLSAGHVRDGCAVCPWHAWAFDLETGACPDNPAISVATYPTRVIDGRVQARLDRTA